ncbi:MAG TPA: MarR family transcriptional regulator [Saprospirales bacterium]|jgi:DNA-binding MarR family transcriptional regulator|nr:MarR family transcriptional regulator [Saprospirales bacterium]
MNFEDQIRQTKFRNNFLKAILNLKYTSSLYNSKEVEVFKKYGILAQHFNVLRIVRGVYPDSVSPGKILEVMLDSGRDLTRLVDKLVKLGLLIRSTCPYNRRRVDINITEEGLALTDKIGKDVDVFLDSIETLTDKESEQLSNLLDKLRND